MSFGRDGFNDLVKFDGSGTCPYRRNHGGASFSAPATIPCPALTLDQIDIADLDGDGFLDLAQKPTSGPWSYHRIDDLGFQYAGTWPGTDTIPHRATFADVNGDGRADAIAYTGSSGFYDFYIATPTGFGPRNFRGLDAEVPFSAVQGNITIYNRPDEFRITDFDKDGFSDVVEVTGFEPAVSFANPSGSVAGHLPPHPGPRPFSPARSTSPRPRWK